MERWERQSRTHHPSDGLYPFSGFDSHDTYGGGAHPLTLGIGQGAVQDSYELNDLERRYSGINIHGPPLAENYGGVTLDDPFSIHNYKYNPDTTDWDAYATYLSSPHALTPPGLPPHGGHQSQGKEVQGSASRSTASTEERPSSSSTSQEPLSEEMKKKLSRNAKDRALRRRNKTAKALLDLEERPGYRIDVDLSEMNGTEVERERRRKDVRNAKDRAARKRATAVRKALARKEKEEELNRQRIASGLYGVDQSRQIWR
ncbi:hypothetical protein CBS101457_003456 [Exobasidium rhododendri]|nr:hypothetical protein CBS101457_003456 [Exobasidium rhododendri]